MNGLKFRYRPTDEVIREIDNCGSRIISDQRRGLLRHRRAPKEVMRATPVPDVIPMPPILPLKREWREAVLEGTAGARME